MNYKNLSQGERDSVLKSQLLVGIVNIIDRYRLISSPDLKWISKKENSHEHIIFTHKFLQGSDELGAFFRANYLCLAKLKYYRQNIHKYEFTKYHPEKGFEKTDISDSDFLMHKASGQYIDYRFLQRITDIKIFKEFCSKLEQIEKDKV